MPLNQKQQQAVDYLDGPLLVLAGPGTGKTQLLSSKVAHILNTQDINPENILCLTFTEAGASNMRERLLSLIGQEANGVNIHTYHAFGTDILGQYRNYAENFDRNLNNKIDTVTQYKIINEIIDKLPISDILKTNDLKDIIATISEVKSAGLNSDDLFKITEQNLKDTEAMNPRISEILDDIVPRMKLEDGLKVYDRIDEVLKEFVSTDFITKRIEREANDFARTFANARNEAISAEKPSIKYLTAWRNKNFEKDKNSNWRFSNFIANKKLLSLANVLKSYEDYLARNNLFDFADMIQQSIKILKNDDGFRATLQERYQYILLDEFQDTNPSQFELVKLISNKELTYIMAVGDDDQAIFEFQGASANNLFDFREEYDAKVINLSENYRSTTEIVDFGRKIADQIENSFAKTYNYNKTLTAARNDEITKGETRPLISRHEFTTADSEYAFIAKKINELIESGEKQNEIAIIAPKHKYILPILPYLKSYDKINVSYEKRENVLEDEYIRQLTTLARFIYEVANGENPAYRLLEILTFPYFDIPAIEAITILRSDFNDQRGPFEYLKESKNEKIKETAILLSELVAKSFETPLELFIDYLIGNIEIKEGIKSPFLDYYSKEGLNFKTYNLYENLSVLREHISEHLKIEKSRLKDFITFLDDYEAAGEAILNTSPYQDSENSIQVLTAHKSKGLEYKHVFLIAVDDISWGNGKGNTNKLSLPKNLQQIRHTGDTDDECLRVFFVAATRAKKTLTMTNSLQDYSGKTPNRLEYLGEYKNADDNVVSPLLKNTEVFEHYEELSENERLENVEKHWISNYLNLTPDLKPILLKRVENFKMTASALTRFIDIVYGGPLAFYNEYVINGPREPSSDSMIFGNLLHFVFEQTTNNKLSDEDAIKLFHEELDKLDLEDKEKRDIIERGEISLKESLKSFREILVPSDNKIKPQAEVNLSFEHLSYNNIPITGKIDHININEKDKTIEIYDFKTGGYHKEKWTSNSTLYKYALQLGFYKLLLNTSPTYSKYNVTRAHILFVSPSNTDLAVNKLEGVENELVHDKIYDFNTEEETDLKELIDAVYKHIKSLDFIDENSPLAVLADSTKRIKDIKEFCELIKATAK